MIKIDKELDDVHGFEEGEEVAVIIKGVQYILICHLEATEDGIIYRLC